MKKILVITCVLGLLFALSSVAFATETNWAVNLRTERNCGLGTWSGFTDAWGDGPAGGSEDPNNWMLDEKADIADANNKWWGCTTLDPDGSGKVTNADYRAPVSAPTAKTWDIRIAAATNRADSTLTVLLGPKRKSDDPSFFPWCPQVVGGYNMVYKMKMVDNKGKAGAPANDTEWTLPTSDPGENGMTVCTLPYLKLTANNYTTMMSEGYKLQLIAQPTTPIPEPSSLLALGTGIAGLAGFVAKRRRV